MCDLRDEKYNIDDLLKELTTAYLDHWRGVYNYVSTGALQCHQGPDLLYHFDSCRNFDSCRTHAEGRSLRPDRQDLCISSLNEGYWCSIPSQLCWYLGSQYGL